MPDEQDRLYSLLEEMDVYEVHTLLIENRQGMNFPLLQNIADGFALAARLLG